MLFRSSCASWRRSIGPNGRLVSRVLFSFSPNSAAEGALCCVLLEPGQVRTRHGSSLESRHRPRVEWTPCGCHARLIRRASLLRLRRPRRSCRLTRSYWRGHPLGLPAGCCRRYSLHGCLARVVVRRRLHPPSDKRKRVRVGRTYRIRPRLSDACVVERIEKITIHACNSSGG